MATTRSHPPDHRTVHTPLPGACLNDHYTGVEALIEFDKLRKARALAKRFGLRCPHCYLAGTIRYIRDREAFREHLRSHGKGEPAH
jgi:hypothetical protein